MIKLSKTIEEEIMKAIEEAEEEINSLKFTQKEAFIRLKKEVETILTLKILELELNYLYDD